MIELSDMKLILISKFLHARTEVFGCLARKLDEHVGTINGRLVRDEIYSLYK